MKQEPVPVVPVVPPVVPGGSRNGDSGNEEWKV